MTTRTASEDHRWMDKALELARGVLYVPAPNPRVGCVIVRDSRLLASGATQAAGQAHAEMVALAQLKQQQLDANGATVYVTLEPCSHTGKTPPCVQALITAQPKRVVIAQVDPNPRVAGRGVAALRAAGIAVTVGVSYERAVEINAGFNYRNLFGRPYVWLKAAASLDGHTTTESGKSKWITGSQARDDGHHWRARSCVVLTGIGTVKADNPQLNVRAVSTPRQPGRAVVDSRLEIPMSSYLLDEPGLLIFAAQTNPEKLAQLEARGATVVFLPQASSPERVDLSAVLAWLAAQEINEVHVEAGARLNGALWDQHLVDELLVYLAPVVLGAGAPMLATTPVEDLDGVERLKFIETALVGDDVRMRLRMPDRWNQALHDIDALNKACTAQI